MKYLYFNSGRYLPGFSHFCPSLIFRIKMNHKCDNGSADAFIKLCFNSEGNLGIQSLCAACPFHSGRKKSQIVGQKVLNVWLKTFVPCSGKYEHERTAGK